MYISYVSLSCVSVSYISVSYVSVSYVSVSYISVSYVSVTYISVSYISVSYVSVSYISVIYISVSYVPVSYITAKIFNEMQNFYKRVLELILVPPLSRPVYFLNQRTPAKRLLSCRGSEKNFDFGKRVLTVGNFVNHSRRG